MFRKKAPAATAPSPPTYGTRIAIGFRKGDPDGAPRARAASEAIVAYLEDTMGSVEAAIEEVENRCGGQPSDEVRQQLAASLSQHGVNMSDAQLTAIAAAIVAGDRFTAREARLPGTGAAGSVQ